MKTIQIAVLASLTLTANPSFADVPPPPPPVTRAPVVGHPMAMMPAAPTVISAKPAAVTAPALSASAPAASAPAASAPAASAPAASAPAASAPAVSAAPNPIREGPSDVGSIPVNPSGFNPQNSTSAKVTANVAPATASSGIPSGLQAAQQALLSGKKGKFPMLKVTPAPKVTPVPPVNAEPPSQPRETREQKEMAREAAQVWAHSQLATAVEPEEHAERKPHISRKERDAIRVQKFEAAYQGHVYDVPAGGYFITVEASAPILRVIIPPPEHEIDGQFSYEAKGKFLPGTDYKVFMVRLRRAAAWHPLQVTLEFAGGIRTLYMLPKPMSIGKTISVQAPAVKRVPKPIPRNISGNPFSRFLPAIRAVWEQSATIPGFSATKPPRHKLNYGRLELTPVAAFASASGDNWMILWKVSALHGKTSNISPAQFSGPGIEAVSLNGTRVSPHESPMLLTVEGVARG